MGMRRRAFLAGLGAAVLLPQHLNAQSGVPRRIGILMNYADTDPEPKAWILAFKARLQELGPGNLAIEERWASADKNRLAAFAAELVAWHPDVLFCFSTPSVAALQRITRTIPIVFVNANDPVGFGFVSSLARPSGNITGFVSHEPSMGGKWLQLLKEIAPSTATVLMPFNPQTHTKQYFKSVESSAATLAIRVVELPYATEADIQRGFQQTDLRNAGLLVPPDSSNAFHHALFAKLAETQKLPAIYYHRLFVEGGGLASYGADYLDASRKGAEYVDRILKGAKVAELPVQAPTKFQFSINLKAAKKIGLTVSPLLLARADEVIE